MNKIAFKILLFLLPVIAITIFFEHELKNVDNSYTAKKRELKYQADSIEVLITGNSQSLFGINPEFFSKYGFSVANVAQSLYFDTRIVLKCIDSLPHLKYVIIPISYIALPTNTSDIEDWRDPFYSTTWGIKPPNAAWYDLYKYYSRILLYSPRHSFEYMFKGFHVRTETSEIYQHNGWAKIDTTDVAHRFSDSDANAMLSWYNPLYNRPSVLKSNCDALDTLISTLKKKHVTPIIITIPAYITFYNNAVHKDVFYAIIKDICNANNCTFYDYLHDGRFNRKDYYDCEHLNATGAEKFSRILDYDILKSH